MGIGRRRVSAIILYGSFASGDFHEGSDVDSSSPASTGTTAFTRFLRTTERSRRATRTTKIACMVGFKGVIPHTLR